MRLFIRMAIIPAIAVFWIGCLKQDLLKTDPTDSHARIQAIPALISWARKNGAQLDKKFSVEYIDGFGLGLVAGESISEGERYLTIDSKLLIGRDSVLKDKYLAYVISILPRNMQTDIKLLLTLFLLHHKHAQKKASFWWPYIRTLPNDYGESPFFWDEERLETLKGSYISDLVVSDRRRLRSQFEKLKTGIFDRFPELFPAAAADLDAFLWAVWTVSSRLFFIEGRSPREHLVPLADMINGMEPADPSRLAFVEPGPADNQVQLRADRPVVAGDQIFESYGGKSGLETFYYEGFLPEPPGNDCVWIYLAFGAPSSAPRWRCVGTAHVKKAFRLNRLRASVEHALSKNTFDAAGKDSDNTATRFRRQEKRQLNALINEIDEESKRRQETDTTVPDPSLPLPSRPIGFSLGGRCGHTDSQCLQKKADDVNRWVINLDAVLKVKVAPVPDMRMGAVATMPISTGDPYIQMPAEALLDESCLAESSLWPLIEKVNHSLKNNHEEALNEYERLRLLLLTEAGKEEQSRFAPYLNSLPGDFADSPITWSYDALRLLGFSRAGAYAVSRRRVINAHFMRFKKYVVPVDQAAFGWVSFEDFVWASLVLFTRCIWLDGACHLVPVLDMVNCAAGPAVNPYKPHQTRFDLKAGTTVTSARGDFKKGQQVFENYDQPNVTYSFKHGFVLDNNPQDAVWVRLGRKSILVGPGRLSRLLNDIEKTEPDEDPQGVLARAVKGHLKKMEYKAPLPTEKFGRESAAFKLAKKLYKSQRQTLLETLDLLRDRSSP